MMRKLLFSCAAMRSSGVNSLAEVRFGLTASTLPERNSSLPWRAVRPEEMVASRSRRAFAQPGSRLHCSISASDVARWSRTSMVEGVRWKTWRRSEEHTSELQSLMRNSSAVFCLKKKNNKTQTQEYIHYTCILLICTHQHNHMHE